MRAELVCRDLSRLLLVTFAVLSAVGASTGCGGERGSDAPTAGREESPPPPARDDRPDAATGATASPTYDIDALGQPAIIEAHYVDLDNIARISRFRSGAGHDYADDRESCRSMKHYFVPMNMDVASSIVVRAPFTGHVVRTREEWAGTQLEIASDRFPAFSVVLFHVSASRTYAVGDGLVAGAPLGTHVGPQTSSDIAVLVVTPKGRRLVSYFEVMPDALFATYRARGIASRRALVIDRAERDESPLSCRGGAFEDAGTIGNWVDLD